VRISEFRRLNPRQREAYERSLEALHLMRTEGLSLGKAAKQAGTTAQTVQKYVGEALRLSRGEWQPRREDNLLREVRYTTPEGRTEAVLVRGSAEARKVAEWQSAVLHYERTGDASHLRRLRYKTFVDATGRRHRLVTDPRRVRDLAYRGLIDIEDVESP